MNFAGYLGAIATVLVGIRVLYVDQASCVLRQGDFGQELSPTSLARVGMNTTSDSPLMRAWGVARNDCRASRESTLGSSCRQGGGWYGGSTTNGNATSGSHIIAGADRGNANDIIETELLSFHSFR